MVYEKELCNSFNSKYKVAKRYAVKGCSVSMTLSFGCIQVHIPSVEIRFKNARTLPRVQNGAATGQVTSCRPYDLSGKRIADNPKQESSDNDTSLKLNLQPSFTPTEFKITAFWGLLEVLGHSFAFSWGLSSVPGKVMP